MVMSGLWVLRWSRWIPTDKIWPQTKSDQGLVPVGQKAKNPPSGLYLRAFFCSELILWWGSYLVRKQFDWFSLHIREGPSRLTKKRRPAPTTVIFITAIFDCQDNAGAIHRHLSVFHIWMRAPQCPIGPCHFFKRNQAYLSNRYSQAGRQVIFGLAHKRVICRNAGSLDHGGRDFITFGGNEFH